MFKKRKEKIMNLNSYEAKVLGKEYYLEIAKRHNLLTQKHTYGRLKEFKKEIKFAMKEMIRL